MALLTESKAHVFAAGLALVAGYGAAACASTGRGGQSGSAGRPSALDGAASVAAFERAAPRMVTDGGLIVSSQLARPASPGKGPLRSGGLRDLAFRDGDQLVRLAWASVPALPKRLSLDESGVLQDEALMPVLWAAPAAPLPQAEAKWEGIAPGMPVLTSLVERMGVQGLGAQMLEDSPLFGARRKRSEPSRLPMSRSHGLHHAYSHAGDPLAVLPFDEDARPAPEFIMPFANGRVTSLFNQGRRHPAIDLAGALGSPVLITTVRQKVTFAGWRGGYGNAVITIDDFGRTHLYGHLQRITAQVGQRLSQGDKLGHLGSTGHSTGPHVHYEVRDSRGTHINPVTLLFPGRGVSKGYAWLDVRQESVLARLAARSR